MQKHAYRDKDERYRTVYEPLPAPISTKVYRDRDSVYLPCSEDFPKLHFHDHYEIGLCESGEGLFLSDGEFASVSVGDVVFIAPRKHHYSRSLHADAPCIFRFIYIAAPALEGVLSSLSDLEPEVLLRIADGIPLALRADKVPELVKGIFETSPASPNADSTAILRLCTFILESATHVVPSQSEVPLQKSDVIIQIAEYIALHYNANDSASELAALCYLSESQLRRKFIACYGLPPIAFRNELRCRVGEQLLVRTDLPISSISERLGYSSPSVFYRMFQKSRGVSPRTFRTKK